MVPWKALLQDVSLSTSTSHPLSVHCWHSGHSADIDEMMRHSDVQQQIHQSATMMATKLMNQINQPRLFQHLLCLLLTLPRCAEVTQKKTASQRRQMMIKVILISRSSHTVPTENTKITANGRSDLSGWDKKWWIEGPEGRETERRQGKCAKVSKMSCCLLETH